MKSYEINLYFLVDGMRRRNPKQLRFGDFGHPCPGETLSGRDDFTTSLEWFWQETDVIYARHLCIIVPIIPVKMHHSRFRKCLKFSSSNYKPIMKSKTNIAHTDTPFLSYEISRIRCEGNPPRCVLCKFYYCSHKVITFHKCVDSATRDKLVESPK